MELIDYSRQDEDTRVCLLLSTGMQRPYAGQTKSLRRLQGWAHITGNLGLCWIDIITLREATIQYVKDSINRVRQDGLF